MRTHYYIIAAALAALVFTSCEKVSPIGVLVSGTAVEDRVKMSHLYYQQYKNELEIKIADDEYTFIVGGDSHVTTDPGRMDEMLAIGLQNNDLLYAHLGDIADTKAEYYIVLDSLIGEAKKRYINKYYDVDKNNPDKYTLKSDPQQSYLYSEITFPFFPVVGNHDLTHNGWALWSNIFHSSFYEFPVIVINRETGAVEADRFIFLDTASGTMGQEQINLIEDGVLDGSDGIPYRHTFVFSHTNIFRPSSTQFASTFPREETFFLLNQFAHWNCSIVFCGHVHAWDEREFEGVTYLTLDSMSERNSPEPGDYLVRVHVKNDGSLTWEKVHMNYTAKKK